MRTPLPAQRVEDLLRAQDALLGERDLADLVGRVADEACGLVRARSATVELATDSFEPDEPDAQPVGIRPIRRINRIAATGAAGRSDPPLARLDDDGTTLTVELRSARGRLAWLHLRDSWAGGFSDVDAAVASAFASTAAAVLDSARRHAAEETRRSWLEAGADITRLWCAESGEHVFAETLRRAVVCGSADFASLALCSGPSRELSVVASVGSPQPVGGTGAVGSASFAAAAAEVARSGRTRLIRNDPAGPGHAGSQIIAPLLADDRVLGTFGIARCRSRSPFAAEEVTQVELFAQRIGMAVALARRREYEQTRRLADERDRIAARLNAHAISGLFGVGIELQGLVHAVDSAELQARILDQVARLDAVVGEIRSAIFDVGVRGAAGRPGPSSVIRTAAS